VQVEEILKGVQDIFIDVLEDDDIVLNYNTTLKGVQDIFIDVLEDDDIVLNYDTTADDIIEWDSLNHVVIIVEIEKKFNLKFKLEEIQSFSW